MNVDLNRFKMKCLSTPAFNGVCDNSGSSWSIESLPSNIMLGDSVRPDLLLVNVVCRVRLVFCGVTVDKLGLTCSEIVFFGVDTRPRRLLVDSPSFWSSFYIIVFFISNCKRNVPGFLCSSALRNVPAEN